MWKKKASKYGDYENRKIKTENNEEASRIADTFEKYSFLLCVVISKCATILEASHYCLLVEK